MNVAMGITGHNRIIIKGSVVGLAFKFSYMVDKEMRFRYRIENLI